MAPPFKEAEFDVMYGKGISREGELLDLGAKLNIVQKSGSWFGYKDLRLGQGRDNAKEYLAANPELAKEIEAQIRENFDKLTTKPAKGASGKTAKPQVEAIPETPEAPTSAPAKKTSKANIDILVDDE